MTENSCIDVAKHFKRRIAVVEFTVFEIACRCAWTDIEIDKLATREITPYKNISKKMWHVYAFEFAPLEGALLDLSVFGAQQCRNLSVKFDVGEQHVYEMHKAIIANGFKYIFVYFAIFIRLPQETTYLGPFPSQKMLYVFGVFIGFIGRVGVKREAYRLLRCDSINGLSLDHCSPDMLKIRSSRVIIVISCPNSCQNIHGLTAIPPLRVGYYCFECGYTCNLVVWLFVIGKQFYTFDQQIRKTGIIIDRVLAYLLFYLAIRFLASPDNRGEGNRGYSHCGERHEHSCPQSHILNSDRILAIPSKNPAGGEQCAGYRDPNQYIGSIEPTGISTRDWLLLNHYFDDSQFRMLAFSSVAYLPASIIQFCACLELSGPDRWRLRSRTYPGIANAMADQWGGVALSAAAALNAELEVAS